MERMVRRWDSVPADEVQKLFDEAVPETYAVGGLGGGPYMLPYAGELVGRSYCFLFDDRDAVELRFDTLHELVCRTDGREWSVHYDAHEAEPGLYFVNFALKPSVPPQVFTLVFDTDKGGVTLCHAVVGNECEARELTHTFYFGTIRGMEVRPEDMHHFTSDLVGKAIYWTYHEGGLAVKHIYSSEYYYTYAMQVPDHCWMASNPADFVKINDHQYIFSFLEERQAGSQGLFLINTETLHDVGCFTGVTPDSTGKNHFESYTVGAKGSWADPFTYFTE